MAIHVDTGYVRSCYGILKIIEIVCLFLAWVCFLDATTRFGRFSRENFFLAITLIAWFFVLIWFFSFFLFVLCMKITFNNQLIIYGAVHLIFGLLLIVAGALIAERAASFHRIFCKFHTKCEIYEVAAAFGIISGFILVIDGIYHIYQHQSGATRVHVSGGNSRGKTTVTTTRTVVKTTKTTKK